MARPAAGGRNELALGPPLVYPAKAALTRARSLLWLGRGGERRARPGIRILFYHRVSDERDELAVRVDRFRAQMRTIAAAGYRVVDVVEAADAAAAGASARVVGLSFDDGYRDVAENAAPVLAALGFRATVFVATGVTDGRAPFTWYQRHPPVLRWDEIERLDGEGVLGFEAHTVTHPNLLALDDAAAREEIAGSKRELEERLGRPVTTFCYPGGLFGPRDRELVAAAGFRFAVSCEPGANGPRSDPLALRRLQVDARDGLLDFRAKVGGGHDAPPPLRAAYRRLRYGVGREPA